MIIAYVYLAMSALYRRFTYVYIAMSSATAQSQCWHESTQEMVCACGWLKLNPYIVFYIYPMSI